MFGRPETIVCAPGKCFERPERFLLASGICSERPETFVCASGKHADVPASVVGFGGTTDVRDCATGEALTHPRVGGTRVVFQFAYPRTDPAVNSSAMSLGAPSLVPWAVPASSAGAVPYT